LVEESTVSFIMWHTCKDVYEEEPCKACKHVAEYNKLQKIKKETEENKPDKVEEEVLDEQN